MLGQKHGGMIVFTSSRAIQTKFRSFILITFAVSVFASIAQVRLVLVWFNAWMLHTHFRIHEVFILDRFACYDEHRT